MLFLLRGVNQSLLKKLKIPNRPYLRIKAAAQTVNSAMSELKNLLPTKVVKTKVNNLISVLYFAATRLAKTRATNSFHLESFKCAMRHSFNCYEILFYKKIFGTGSLTRTDTYMLPKHVFYH